MLTVIIPCYNHEKYIQACLSAVLRINVPGLKLIVIDDGSIDNTVTKAKEILEATGGDSEVIEKTNSGLVSSLNLGLSLVKTEYVYFCASDDIPNPHGIKDCVELLVKQKEAGFVIGGAVNFFDDSRETTTVYNQRHEKFFGDSFDVRKRNLFLNYPSPILLQSTIFRTKALLDIGGWDSDLVLDDYPIFIKMLLKYSAHDGYIFSPEVTAVAYRHHGSNSYKEILKQFLRVSQTIKKLAPGEIKSKSLAKVCSYYLLQAVRSKDIDTTCKLLRTVDARILWWIPFYILLHLLRALRK